MKRAKQRRTKPRNPVATSPLLAKGGAHARRDKRAQRARQKNRLLREIEEA
jgi:hypothetical protein